VELGVEWQRLGEFGEREGLEERAPVLPPVDVGLERVQERVAEARVIEMNPPRGGDLAAPPANERTTTAANRNRDVRFIRAVSLPWTM